MATDPCRITWKALAGWPSRIAYAPASRTRSWPQPAIAVRWAGASAARTGTSASSSSTAGTVVPFARARVGAHVGGADGRRLLGDVDRHRAPGDAAPAAHAARRAELVDPGGQLVGHPLAVAGTAAGADAAAVDVGVLEVEAGVPAPGALGLLAREVGDVVDAVAEARGADQRAVAAGQAAVGHLLPAGVLEVAQQELADIAGLHRAAHLRGGALDHPRGLEFILARGIYGRELVEHLPPAF